MPLKTQRRRERVGEGEDEEVEDGWGVEGIKKIFYICCHALWNILLGTNGECKAVQSKDHQGERDPVLQDVFFFFLSKWQYRWPPTV